MTNETTLPTTRVVDLTCDITKRGEPLRIRNDAAGIAKILNANDAFFGFWEDCLQLQIITTDAYFLVHCYTSACEPSLNPGRLHQQYGWLMCYFDDVAVVG